MTNLPKNNNATLISMNMHVHTVVGWPKTIDGSKLPHEYSTKTVEPWDISDASREHEVIGTSLCGCMKRVNGGSIFPTTNT